MGKGLKQLGEYREELLTYLEPTMNRMMLIGAGGAIFALINTLIVRPNAWVHVIFTSSTTLLLLGLYAFRQQVSADNKVTIVTIFLSVYGSVLLFTNNELAGILLIFLNVVLAIFLKETRYQIVFLSLTTGVVVLSFINASGGDWDKLSNYAYSVTIYLVLVTIFPIAFRAIYYFLYNKLDLLQEKLQEEERIIHLLQHKNNEIEKLAYFDRITGLYNRHRMSNLLDVDLKQNICGSLVFVDIKNFKKINDLYGVKHADVILADIAALILRRVAESGYVGYLGANTFVIYTHESIGREDYLTQVNLLQSEINHSLNLAVSIEFYSVCIVAELGQHQPEDYYKLAEEYLSAMKSQGIQQKYVDEHVKKAQIEEDARRQFILDAIDKSLYEVHYQEKFDVQRQQVIGVEALARLRYNGNYVSPGIFIPIVEADEHIISFGYLMLDLVFRQMKRITELYGDIRVSVNLSPKQLADKDIYDNVKRLIAMYQVAPQRLELEITENELITNIEEFTGVIQNFKDLGIKFAIDDFGTGYSSLGYLSVLPADVLKIDKSFIDTIHTDNKKRAIVKAILDIAGASGMEIVAEGVETTEQLNALRSLGVNVIQGYLFSIPKALS